MVVDKVEWTDTVKASLKVIYNYHAEYSENSAENIINEIIDTADSIVFTQQYQVDAINSKYRRIIVRDYKVLYTEKNNIVQIMDVVSTKKSPKELGSK